MLKIRPKRTPQEWVEAFRNAKHGHVLWDGWAADPYDPIHAYNSSHQFVQHAEALGFFRSGGRVLDLGCGNGRLGIALSERLVEYVGIDPLRESVDFCRWVFAGFASMRFEFADIYNQCFNPGGTISPADWRIPYPDGYFQDVIAYSVFTHLETLEAAWNYMNEIRRVLAPGGKLFVSWYRSPPNTPDPFVGRTSYQEWDIMSMMQGFSFQYTYGGHTDKYYDQWAMFATRT